jgi:hypothetical protein
MDRQTHRRRSGLHRTSSLLKSLEKIKNKREAVSPAISTVVLTGAIVTMLVATIPFARNYLNVTTARFEFSSMELSMQNMALQLDDVAWTIGRTQTFHYTSNFGWVSFSPLSLCYTVYVDKGSGYALFANYSTGILMFKMATNMYSLGNNYFQPLFPSGTSFLENGTAAPISHVFTVERLPMSDGSYIRVVVAPSIRMLNTSVQNLTYCNFYLPILVAGSSSYTSQSVRLVGNAISLNTISLNTTSPAQRVKIQVSFPAGFDETFFNFDNLTKEVSVAAGSIIQFYTMSITVSLGVS